MGVVIKQSFWGTVIAYIGVIVGYLNALYFRAEYFDLDQIGLFTLITANAMIISPVSSFGMGSSLLKYFPNFQNENRNRFFTFLLLITLLGNALILAIGYLMRDLIAARYADSAPTFINFLSITAIIIVSNSLFELFFAYSRIILKIVFPSFLRDIYLRVASLLLVFGYAVHWWSFNDAIMGLGLVYLLAFIILFLQIILIHKLRFDFHFGIITKEWRIKLMKFGFYSMLMAGSFGVLNNITYDQITITLGSEMNGIFTTCFFIAMIVEMPRRNMANIIAPIISKQLKEQNMVEVNKIYRKSSITMSVIGLLLFMGIATNLNDLFDFIPKGDSFQLGFWVVIYVCTAKLVLMASSFASEVINFSHLYRYNLLFQILAAITLISLNVIFIPIWGLNGAGISYLITILFHNILKLTFVRYHFGIHPFMKSHVPLAIIGIVVSTIAFLIQPQLHPIINILIRSILTSVVFISLIYRFRISDDINRLIHATFERFLKIKLTK
ncbi:MAG: oligosaccharide flippase family protein [Ekhidna sp.]